MDNHKMRRLSLAVLLVIPLVGIVFIDFYYTDNGDKFTSIPFNEFPKEDVKY